MNWVGGTRNRYMIKNDMKKQREFFEKKRLQQKMKHLGIPSPNSPKSTSSGSMDLVTLFIVNQITARKENSEPPKITQMSEPKKILTMSIRDMPLELPMSPCSPSHLSLVESQPHYSVPSIRKRKHCLSEQLKYHQLSPVLESNLSDKSASDNQHHIEETFSPFSSISSSSSGRFPHQQKSEDQPQNMSLPQNMSSSEKLQFKTVSQLRGVRACTPCISVSSGLQNQIDTPSVARGLFRSTEPHNIEARQVNECSLSYSEIKEPLLQVNESEREEQHAKDIFSCINSKVYGAESSHSGYHTSKTFLKEETNCMQRAQEQIDTKTKGPELDYLTQLSNCDDVTCPGNNSGQVNCLDSSPSYSPRGGYISSDSDDDKDDYQQYSHSGFYQDVESLREETFNLCKAPQRTTRLGPSQTRPRIQQTVSRCNGNCSDDNRSKERSACSEGLSSNVGSYNNVQLIPSQLQSFTDSQPKMRARQTQDMATQTVGIQPSRTCEASTQCSWMPKDEVDYLPDRKSNSCNQAVDSVVQHLTTRGQSGHREHAEIQQALRISANSYRKGEEPPTPKINQVAQREDEVVVGYPSVNKTCYKTESSASISRSSTPLLEYLIVTNETEGFELMAGCVDERKIDDLLETESLMKDLPEEREEVASAGGVNRLSEEAETLQEIADILLMLKQKNRMDNKGAR